MAGHAQLKFVMTECSKTQIRLTGLIYFLQTETNFCSCRSQARKNSALGQLSSHSVRLVYELRHDKTNKMTVRPAKTKIKLGIRQV